MVKGIRSIEIQAPVEKIYEFLTLPTNLVEIWPSMVEAKDLRKLPNGGYYFNWVYKMAGIRFEGSSEDIEVDPCHKVVSKSKGGIDSTITFTFEPQEAVTKVTFEVEYNIPIPLIGKLAETIIVRQNEHETEALLANLKTRMEA